MRIFDYRETARFYGGAWQYVEGGGDHAFQRFGERLPSILRFALANPGGQAGFDSTPGSGVERSR